jgi:transcriptional regulator with XRE-family HTH domain
MDKIHQVFLDKLGKNIEKEYLKKFPSQYAFAKEIGCDSRTIRRVIRGEQNASILLLLKISEALEVELSSLLPETTEK